MKVLIIGGGGREHALAWKAAQSPKINKIYVAPGNAGTALEDKVENVDISAEDIPALLKFAETNNINLTIVGPEAPLVAGVVDQFKKSGLRIYGPSKAAAQLEGSKAFTKDFLAKYNIPTAAYQTFTDPKAAIDYINAQGTPIVIKADGLAAGKGVILAQTIEEATAAVEDMLSGNAFGEAGHRVVIEEFLTGEEASFIVMVDGKNILPMASSQDHKARDNDDKGPNTGGMGAYSPAPVVTDEMHARIMNDVIKPTVEGMEKDGCSYTGFLYAGVMIDKNGIPKVLEYNCRFGDPETQPIMFRLESDLVTLCEQAIDGKLNETEIKWNSKVAVGVVLAADGYPTSYPKGDKITGLNSDFPEEIKVFHAGTKQENDQIVTNGGRVLCVTALGNNILEAQEKAYMAIKQINWQGVYYRTDIGYRAIAREKSAS